MDINAIKNAQKKYPPDQLVKIDSLIRRLASEHYRYGKTMPLVLGKATGIQNVLYSVYNVNVKVQYVWDVLESFKNEPGGGW